MRSCLIVIAIFAVCFGILLGKWWAWVLLAIAIVAFVLMLLIEKEEKKEREQEQANQLQQKEECAERYKIEARSVAVPADAEKVTVLSASVDNTFMQGVQYFLWKQEGLSLFPTEPVLETYHLYTEAQTINISLDSIEYFYQTGEIYRETKISGGGGGGASIGGAIVGGVIAGDAGAVIGSRKKTDEIKSETITHDTRETVLNYFSDGKRNAVHFAYSDFSAFKDLFPEKEKSIVDSINANKIIAESLEKDRADNIANTIKSLADLRDGKGILSETEFEEKKKILLEKIK